MHITLSNITLTTNMHECFLFIYLFLFCKIFMSKNQNIIFIFKKKKITNESYEIRMEKNAEK